MMDFDLATFAGSKFGTASGDQAVAKSPPDAQKPPILL
jgi:hypothetical protein